MIDFFKPILNNLFFIFSPVFLMTCKPPLYMGPEYIKYFSDKTIDVSTGCSGRLSTVQSRVLSSWFMCTGWAGEGQPCDMDCWILCQLVSRVSVLCFSVCRSLPKVGPASPRLPHCWRPVTRPFTPSAVSYRYNCTGLKFGKVDIGRYGEVSKK